MHVAMETELYLWPNIYFMQFQSHEVDNKKHRLN